MRAGEIRKWIVPVTIAVIAIAAVAAAFWWHSYLVSRALATNQEACLKLEQSMVMTSGQDYRTLGSVSGRDHFNLGLGKCIVELDLNIIYPSEAIVSDDFMIYDAAENNELAECTAESGLGASDSPYCLDYRNPEGTGTNISKAQFDTLEKQYMSE